MSYLELPQGRMHYVDEGPRDAPVVVFVHGTPSWSHEWRHAMAALSKTHRCIAPDHLGFGHSDKPPAARFAYHYRDHRQNLEALLAHLGVDRFHLVVHDLGGLIALPLALDAPQRILSLGIVQSWMWDFGDDPEFQRARKLLLSPLMRFLYLRLNFSAKKLVKMAWGSRAPLTEALHREFTDRFPDAASRVGTLAFARLMGGEIAFPDAIWARRKELPQVPTLVIWGEGDKLVTTRHRDRWKEAVPRAEFLSLPEVGHWPQIEAADEVTAGLASLVRRG